MHDDVQRSIDIDYVGIRYQNLTRADAALVTLRQRSVHQPVKVSLGYDPDDLPVILNGDVVDLVFFHQAFDLADWVSGVYEIGKRGHR